MNWNKKILAYSLKNAAEHEGKAAANSVLNSLFHEGLEKKDIKEVMPLIQKTVKEVNGLSLEEQRNELAEFEKEIDHRAEREGLPELPKVGKKGVISRMCPSPSGPLHIGHVLTLLPNFLYSKKYPGKFYLRIEDTNPENIHKPAYQMLKEESRWLCKEDVEVIIQSERMQIYYDYVEKLIGKKATYICTCDSEKFKERSLKSEACPCRDLAKEEQLNRWNKMLGKGKDRFKEGGAVVRFKSDLKDKNPAMRDFPLARINESEHPLQGKKYRVWPLMNLAVTVDDIELGMTHIIRGKDHKDNAQRQKMIYKALGKEKQYPWVGFIGRMHFKDLELSTTKMRKGIEDGKYSGWDDPNLLTLASLRQKGYLPETFWKLTEQRGISEADKILDKKEFYHLLDLLQKEQKHL